jgi:hypothetical protein
MGQESQAGPFETELITTQPWRLVKCRRNISFQPTLYCCVVGLRDGELDISEFPPSELWAPKRLQCHLSEGLLWRFYVPSTGWRAVAYKPSSDGNETQRRSWITLWQRTQNGRDERKTHFPARIETRMYNFHLFGSLLAWFQRCIIWRIYTAWHWRR